MIPIAQKKSRFTQLIEFVILASLFFASFDLILMGLVNKTFKVLTGEYSSLNILLHPSVIIFVAFLFIYNFKKLKKIDTFNKNLLIAALILSGGYILSSSINQTSFELSLRLAFLSGISLIVYYGLMQTLDYERLLKVYLYGFLLWCLLSLIFYAHYASLLWPLYYDYNFSKKIIFTRSPGDQVYNNLPFSNSILFFKFAGNVNKLANLLILNSLLSLYFLRKNLFLVLNTVVFSTILLFLTFSRGAFVVMMVSGLLLAFAYYKEKADLILKKRLLIFTTIFLTPVLLSFSTVTFRSYWRDSSTVIERIEIVQRVRDSDLSLFGIGAGEYGRRLGYSIDTETHNTFLDTLLSGGVFSLGAYIFILLLILWQTHQLYIKSFRFHSIVSLATFSSFILLGMREMSLVYLFSSNIVILVFAFLLSANQRKIKNAL